MSFLDASIDAEEWLQSLLRYWNDESPVLTVVDAAQAEARGLPLERPLDPFLVARRLHAAGASDGLIRSVTGLSEDDMPAALAQFNDEVRDMIALHAQGLTVKQISERLGIGRPLIYYHFRQHKIEPNRTVSKPLTAKQVREILRMYDQGSSRRSIVKALGASDNQVRYVIRTHR